MAVRQAWLEAMESAFGATAERAEILASLDAAQQAVAEAGIGTSGTGRPLTDALERFKAVHFDVSISAARSLGNELDPVAALPHFGRGRRGAVEAGTALANAAQAFLDAVDQNFGATSQTLDAKHGALAASLEQIDTSLAAIESDLAAMAITNGEHTEAA